MILAKQLSCHITLKYHHARQSYELDITGFIVANEQSLSMTYDLEIKASDMIFVCNTTICHSNHLCHIIYKFQHRWPSYGQIRTGFTEIYAQSLSADCDIHVNLWPNNMVLVRDKLFCHDDHLYQIVFKSRHACPNYWPDINRFHWSICTKFKNGLNLDL